MSKVVRKPPLQQTKEERLINLRAARAAKKRKGKTKVKRIGKKRKRTLKKSNNPSSKKTKTMSRRRITNSLTGGTKDVNPQWFGGELKQETVTVAIDRAFQNPVAKGIFGRGNTATIMEILKVYFIFPALGPFAEITPSLDGIRLYLSTRKLLPITPAFTASEPAVFAWAILYSTASFTAGGTVAVFNDPTYVVDLRDSAGHGLLVASDMIWFTVYTLGVQDTTIDTAAFKLLYRFKNVGLAEYIGIVQSQQ